MGRWLSIYINQPIQNTRWPNMRELVQVMILGYSIVSRSPPRRKFIITRSRLGECHVIGSLTRWTRRCILDGKQTRTVEYRFILPERLPAIRREME
jgi:hypothetical protein